MTMKCRTDFNNSSILPQTVCERERKTGVTVKLQRVEVVTDFKCMRSIIPSNRQTDKKTGSQTKNGKSEDTKSFIRSNQDGHQRNSSG